MIFHNFLSTHHNCCLRNNECFTLCALLKFSQVIISLCSKGKIWNFLVNEFHVYHHSPKFEIFCLTRLKILLLQDGIFHVINLSYTTSAYLKKEQMQTFSYSHHWSSARWNAYHVHPRAPKAPFVFRSSFRFRGPENRLLCATVEPLRPWVGLRETILRPPTTSSRILTVNTESENVKSRATSERQSWTMLGKYKWQLRISNKTRQNLSGSGSYLAYSTMTARRATILANFFIVNSKWHFGFKVEHRVGVYNWQYEDWSKENYIGWNGDYKWHDSKTNLLFKRQPAIHYRTFVI